MIKWLHDSIIFIMEIPIPGKTVFILKHGPKLHEEYTWLRFNINMLSYQYMYPDIKDKTVLYPYIKDKAVSPPSCL